MEREAILKGRNTMVINVLQQSEKLFEDSLDAFQAFLESLNYNDPRELILVQPPFVPEEHFDLATARNKGYYAYPPVGLLYIAAVAKEVSPKINVHVMDLNFEILRHAQSEHFSYRFWQQVLFDLIKTCDAPYIGLTYMFGTTKPIFMEVSKFIRENFPDVPVITGGVQATYDYREVLEADCSDVVVRNEGERQFRALFQSCLAGKSVGIPQGVAFKLGGEIYELGTPDGDVPVDWDIRPQYDLLEIQDYNRYGSLGAFSRYNGEEKEFATVLSNRGCRARCTFCTVRDFNGFGIRQRPVQSVVDEIKYLVREKGIKHIDWLDDDLLWDPKRTVELFKGLATEIPELEWTCSNGLIAVAVTEEIMYWMVQSGMKAFKIGIESGNDQMLHLIKKPTTKPKLREKRQLFKRFPEVFVGANFIIGFPNEPFEQMMDSFNFANELQWDWVTYNICQPLKGTEMFSAFQELGDDRCEDESYDKNLMPARSALRGELGNGSLGEGRVLTGRDVFNLPYGEIPSSEQLKEIWFTFNLITNFLSNYNFAPGGNPEKMVKWFEAIHSGYPYDASMCAGLVRGYRLLGVLERVDYYQQKFQSIVSGSPYWQRRVGEFPELLELAEVSRPLSTHLGSSSNKSRNWSGGAI